MKIKFANDKNRNRNQYTFANINLLGKCNFDCRWCLGKDLPEFYQYNQLHDHFSEWKNFDRFLEDVKEAGIQQIYITGQNTDSLCYDYLEELMDHLKNSGFYVGLRTNGYLGLKKIEAINAATTCLGDAVSFTVLTLNPSTHKKIVGHSRIPNWKELFESVTSKMRVAIVIDRFNVHEFNDLIKFLSQFKDKIEYVQVRRISTDTRYDQFKIDIQKYENLYRSVKKNFPLVNEYESAESFNIHGIECSFWRTVKTTANSFNYYTNGVISKEYFIIEGYINNKHMIEELSN